MCLTEFSKFDIMRVPLDIGFDQLVQIAKRLPATQWTKLKKEVEATAPLDKEREESRKLLLKGPTFSKEQFADVAEIRKKIEIADLFIAATAVTNNLPLGNIEPKVL